MSKDRQIYSSTYIGDHKEQLGGDQGIRGQGTVSDLFVGISPFVAVIGIFVAVIIAVPALVTWLPGLMFRCGS